MSVNSLGDYKGGAKLYERNKGGVNIEPGE